jgi:glycosyltransferase involved in cell wall biosynthesis
MENWIIVPLYNEETRFNVNYWNTITLTQNFLFLFVDDGSTDRTNSVLSKLKGPNVHILRLPKNVGKSEAIRSGFLHVMAEGKSSVSLLGYLDSDSAFDEFEVREILQGSGRVFCDLRLDALWMSRVKLAGRNIERASTRHYIGRLIASFLGRGIPEFPYDTQCGFKLFKSTPVLFKAFETKFQTRWFVDLEILCRISNEKSDAVNLRELPLENWREVKNSRIRLRSFLGIFREILAIRRDLASLVKGGKNGSPRA